MITFLELITFLAQLSYQYPEVKAKVQALGLNVVPVASESVRSALAAATLSRLLTFDVADPQVKFYAECLGTQPNIDHLFSTAKSDLKKVSKVVKAQTEAKPKAAAPASTDMFDMFL